MTTQITTAPRDRIAREPGRFDEDQAVAVVANGADPREVRFRSAARLGCSDGAVVAAEPGAARSLTLGGFGLLGVGGALPRHHTATVAAELRKRSAALHAFVDTLGGRFAGLFARAGAKYRPTRDPAPAERALAAAVGLGTGGLAERAGAPLAAVLYHAGHLAARTRSAERLRAMLEEECGGAPVAVREFAGDWLRLPPSEQTRLGGGGRLATGAHSGLGRGATAGAQVWDAGSRFEVRVGPLDRAGFEALLPGRPLHARLAALARLSVGPDTAFAIRPVLAARAVPPVRLPGRGDAAAEGARLGWTSWLGTAPGRARARDGDEASFEAR